MRRNMLAMVGIRGVVLTLGAVVVFWLGMVMDDGRRVDACKRRGWFQALRAVSGDQRSVIWIAAATIVNDNAVARIELVQATLRRSER